MKLHVTCLALSLVTSLVGQVRGPELLSTYCMRCHGERRQKGKVRFDTLDTLSVSDRSALLARAREMVVTGDMPPKSKRRPTQAEVEQLVAWMNTHITGDAENELEEKLRYPHYGNLVDHERLFSGEIDEPAYTPARRWLVSPQIFRERVIDVFRVEERRRKNYVVRGFYGVTNPFLLPEHSGVRYYDVGRLDGGHLLVDADQREVDRGEAALRGAVEAPRQGRRSHRWSVEGPLVSAQDAGGVRRRSSSVDSPPTREEMKRAAVRRAVPLRAPSGGRRRPRSERERYRDVY